MNKKILLRSKAKTLEPLLHIGKNGLSDGLIDEIKCQKFSTSLGLVAKSQSPFAFWKISEHAQEPHVSDGWFLTKQLRRKKLIKLKILKSALSEKNRKELAKELIEKTGAEIIEQVGFVIVLRNKGVN